MEKELPHVLPFQRHLTLFLCFVFQSSRRRHPFTYIHMYVCVLQATPSTLTRRSPPPRCCSCTRCVLLAKFATAFCRDKPKSEAEEIGNLILFSCPATPQHSRSPFRVPLSPSFNACHFCPFSAVSFSPRTVCAKNLIIETLSELEKWNDTNENQPQSDKAVNDGG